MNPSQVLETLKVGDRFTTIRDHRVIEVGNGFVRTRDVNNGEIHFGVPVKADHGSLEIVDVYHCRPKAGDELTADEVRAHQWKSGTVLTGNGYTYVLSSKGDWFSPGRTGDNTLDVTREFHNLDVDLPPGDKFTVVHLP